VRNTFKTRRARVAALATVAAMGSGLGLVSTGTAQAADPIPPVNPSGTGAIVITKLENPGGTISDTYGEEQTSPRGVPLAGATFTVCKVSGQTSPAVTLTTDGPASYAWWEDAAKIAAAFTPATVSNILTTGDASNDCSVGVTTGNDGKAVFKGKGLGLYLVTEKTAPDTDGDGAPDYQAASPFLVTLPLLKQSSNTWLTPAVRNADNITDTYVAYAYPKNPENSVTKTADTSATTSIGSRVPYSITSTVPCAFKPASGSDAATCQLTALTVRDNINTTGAKLDFDHTSLVVTAAGTTFAGPDLSGYSTVPSSQSTALTGDDYSLKWNANPNSGFEIVFTQAGLTKLDGLAASATGLITLQVDYEFIVQELLTATSGMGSEIDNDVNLWWNEPTSEIGTGTDTEVYFGGVMIHKTDAKNNTPLAGAEFKIYATATPNSGPTVAYSDSNTDGYLTATTSLGTAASVFSTTAGTTTTTAGEVGILGLSYDPANPTCWAAKDGSGSVYTTPSVPGDYYAGRAYWVVETKVPDGYVGTGGAIPVCVSGALDGVSSSVDDFTVTNTPRNAGFPLPFTGDISESAPTLFALVLIAGAFTVYVIRTKKTNSGIA